MNHVLRIAVVMLAFTSTESDAGEVIRVLFVGNSLTYYNNLPGMVESIYESSRPDRKMTTELLASAGALVRDHLSTGHLAEILSSTRFDVVVLQELGGFPNCAADFRGCTDSPVALREAITLIRAAGSRPILFGTWQSTPESQRSLSAATKELAKSLQVEVADVGAAIYSAQGSGESPVLNESGHPLPLGSWMAAIVLTKIITMGDVGLKTPSPVCQPDWTARGPSEKTLASRQAQPPQKCYSVADAEFSRLRGVWP